MTRTLYCSYVCQNRGEPYVVVAAEELEADFKAMEGVVAAFQLIAPETALMVVSRNSTVIAALSHVPKACLGKLDANRWISSALVPLGGKAGGKSNTARGTCSQMQKFGEVEILACEYAKEQL